MIEICEVSISSSTPVRAAKLSESERTDFGVPMEEHWDLIENRRSCGPIRSV
jgi:hypothetical protein